MSIFSRFKKPNFSGMWHSLKERFPKNIEDLKKIRGEEVVERARQLFSGRAYGTYIRLSAAAFASYFMADTVSLVTSSFVPEPPTVPPPRVAKKAEKRRTLEDYAAITARNIFSSEGLIPEDQTGLAEGPARKTTLPFNLVGTVVLKNELKSIAAIEDKGQNMIFPVQVDDTITEKAKITKIEHLKVTFVNLSTGNLEYVEIVEEVGSIRPESLRPATPTVPSRKGGVTQRDDTHFDVERTAVDKAMGNLNEVLQQARAIPNFENGMPDGYKLLQIVPGSIYDQLGLTNGDVICGVNGEPINDPGKAFGLFNELRTSNRLELCVKRGGRKTTMNYDIR